MSRTKRMPSVIVEQSQVEYINHAIDIHNLWPTKTTKIRKSRSQYERECEEADEKYYQALHALSEEKSIDGMMYRLTGKHNIYRRWVARYNYERVIVSVEDVIAEAKVEWSKFSRDGNCDETSKSSGFKHASKKTVRNANKRLERKILKDEVYDDTSYPNDYMGKSHLWDFW